MIILLSPYEGEASENKAVLRTTFFTICGLVDDPVIIPTSVNILTWFNIFKEISGMKMTVRVVK
jgi:hypothetical protein